MDTNHYHDFNLLKIWKNVFHTFFDHSGGMKTSCVIYKLGEKQCGMSKTITINKFILMFYLMFGTFMSGFTLTLAEK